MPLRDPKCRYLPSRITGQAPRINLASFLALGHRAHSCLQWHLVTKEVKPAPRPLLTWVSPHKDPVLSPQICAEWSILQNRFTSFCTTYIQKKIYQVQQTVPASPSEHISSCLPTQWKLVFTLQMRKLVWKVLKDYWRLPRKGLMCVHAQSCPTLCNPMDCSLPDSSVLGILQARILEWVAMTSSRGSSPPRDQTLGYDVSCIGRRILHHWTTWGLWWIEHVIWYSY